MGHPAKVHIYPGITYVSYYLHDNLGTTRMIVDQTSTVCYDADYFPWGGEQYVYTNTCPQNYKFTDKERDPVWNGADYFGARWLNWWMGRFFTPDWSAAPTTVPYANFGNPQSLNLYSYVQNNPLTNRDLDGHDCTGGQAGQMQSVECKGKNAGAQNTASSNSDKRTDVMLTPDSVPPKPAVTEGAQFEMDYKITPQADTMKQLQDNVSNTRDDKATQTNYSKMEVKLWESQRGGKWQWQGDALKGHGHDVLNVFAQRADQRWYIDGKRVQLVIGKDSSGNLIKAWTVHVEVKPTGPEFSKGD